MASFGNFWQLLATYGNFCHWQLLVIFGNLWQLLPLFGNLWQLIATYGIFRQLLVTLGHFWELMATNATLQHCNFVTLQLCNNLGLLDRPAGQTSWTDQLDGSAGRICWTDQLDRSAGRISWTDQFSLFEAMASLHIRRLTFQFVHCRSFRVRRRPCYLDIIY